MKLDLVQTFVQVVRAGGFSAAARQTGMPLSTVSLQVSTLEASLGVRLLKRTTRAIRLTEEGSKLLKGSADAVDDLASVLSEIQNRSDVLRGRVHLTAPADLPTRVLAEAITSFKVMHPDVVIQITLTNAKLDFVKDDVDLAIRMAGVSHLDAIQRKLMDFEWAFCASPTWVERNGRPETVEQLTDFIAPQLSLKTYLEHSILGHRTLPPPIIEVENNILVKDLLLSGFGVGILPKGLVEDELRRGRVLTVLDDTILGSSQLTLTFPTRADIVPRVRAFADHVCRVFLNKT